MEEVKELGEATAKEVREVVGEMEEVVVALGLLTIGAGVMARVERLAACARDATDTARPFCMLEATHPVKKSGFAKESLDMFRFDVEDHIWLFLFYQADILW